MCGIAGIWSPDPSRPPLEGELRTMAARLAHRGPDGSGLHIEGPVGLAHTRLAIIDLEGGHQPLCNEDATVWVTFNGEIFNYKELRAELLRLGHVFRTQSDTEVLVHLYEEHGDDFVKALNGQFAIALWDTKRARLLLARDRVGIRPLFFAMDGRRLAFASEVKALFALPGVTRRIDPEGLASIFSLWSVLPPTTVFAGVQNVPPGHLMVVDRLGTKTTCFWTWDFGACDEREDVDEREAGEALRALMADAVRLQLRSDVPVGAYLSGGLDSSIITTIVARHNDADLRSFSLTFNDAEFDESAHQRSLVDHLGTQHSSVRVGASDIGAAFPRMVWHAESPVVRTAPVPMMLLADLVRASGYKVVLTGEGADEAFGGYDIFKEAAIRRRMLRSSCAGAALKRLYPYLAHSPTSLGALAQGHFSTRSSDEARQPAFSLTARMATSRRTLQYLEPSWRDAALAWDPARQLAERAPQGFGSWPPLARDQFVEAQTLMSGYLLSSQGDRMAMAASVEARFPFLDHRVLEFAARLPTRLKLRGLQEKRILKQAWRNELPAGIVNRSKQPYRSPDSASFFEQGRPLPYVSELLSASSLKDAGIFTPVLVDKLVAKCAAGKAIGFGDNISMVGIVSTMLLHRQFVHGGGASAALH